MPLGILKNLARFWGESFLVSQRAGQKTCFFSANPNYKSLPRKENAETQGLFACPARVPVTFWPSSLQVTRIKKLFRKSVNGGTRGLKFSISGMNQIK